MDRDWAWIGSGPDWAQSGPKLSGRCLYFSGPSLVHAEPKLGHIDRDRQTSREREADGRTDIQRAQCYQTLEALPSKCAHWSKLCFQKGFTLELHVGSTRDRLGIDVGSMCNRVEIDLGCVGVALRSHRDQLGCYV